jgi:SpoVK/Ycf46/Vps4 family AAA+-type ATPase
MSIHVPERFRRRVLAHAITASSFERYPLILAIQGPPGDGKSFQVKHVLKENSFVVIANSSALLAGSFEAEPVRQLRDLYGRARDFATANKTRLPVILLEDFDLSPAGRQDGVRYTVNSQLLAAFLMNLADDVASCDVGTTQRFPIFMTGNDFSSVHQPLTRPGRMDVFSWEPTDEERIDVIYGMLNTYIPDLEKRDVDRLSRQYKRYPISFFDATIMDCIASAALNHVEMTRHIDVDELRRRFENGFHLKPEDFIRALRERSDPRFVPRSFLGSRL